MSSLIVYGDLYICFGWYPCSEHCIGAVCKNPGPNQHGITESYVPDIIRIEIAMGLLVLAQNQREAMRAVDFSTRPDFIAWWFSHHYIPWS